MCCCSCLLVEKYPFPERVPTRFLSLRVLGVLALCLPTITAYVCIISTFFTKSDVISNYSLSNCPDVKSPLPPVSYSIGSWEPQRQLWLLAVIVHLPARLLLTMMVTQVWRERVWRLGGLGAASLEMIGLVCVSLFHVESFAGFQVHAFFFVLWVGGTIWGMVVIVHLQRKTGHIDQQRYVFRAWLTKLIIMIAFIVVTASVSVAYPISQAYCNLTAFTIFCIGEYAIIALNSAFWAVVLLEFSRHFEGIQLVSMERNDKVAPETPPSSHMFENKDRI